jgi:hypothetical protein
MHWLRKIWISPAEHQRIVEELQSRINRLEKDYVTVSQSLIGESQARRRAERVRNYLRNSTLASAVSPDGKVIAFEARKPGALRPVDGLSAEKRNS